MEAKKRYYSVNRFLWEQFGKKVYKIALDAGMTCPNRDGTLDTRGCIFCAEGGAGEFAVSYDGALGQIQEAKQRIAKKATKEAGYLAYFQSFTNTYAPIERLEKLFTAAIEEEDIVGLSIATRPDCIGEDVLGLLKRLNRKKPIWIELGLQTANEETANWARRCYKNEVYQDAVNRLIEAGIYVITHVIIGLPGETKEDVLSTIRYAYACGSRGVKLQLLHVLKGSDLEKEYYEGSVPVLEKEAYFSILAYLLERTPKDMVVHRLTGDGPKEKLIAPLWTTEKKNVLNRMNRYFAEHDVLQGARLEK